MLAYSTKIDEKWQKKWEETGLYKFDRNNIDKKLYCLEMFSYPSGAKLHVGHWYNYGLTDTWARLKRMQGWNMFHPQGFDAFGLPAENYAIKTGIHPKDSTYANIRTMEEQLRKMGASFDWDYEVITCAPEYYKWTQWIFLQLYKHGLAYRKKAPVNWCPSCKTVLANEQVVDGCCERCKSEVTKKDLTQWFFKITEYAQELLDCLPQLDWPEKTKKIQQNWIGRSEGAEIVFEGADGSFSFKVFTTRADTLYGVTYVVLAPENELVDRITTPECRDAVEQYREQAKKQTEIERMSTVREKTGVFTGAYAINPVNGDKVPIWIADYVLAGYGTGCVMAVPAHDERDYEFAAKYNLPIKRVIKGGEGVDDTLPFVEDGILVDSAEFTGMGSAQARKEIVKKLNKQGRGEFKVNYRLRDWLVSRQRYWGAPIPVIHCEHCGIVPVPEKDLPVELPYNVEFTPDGESPLAKCEEFINTTCPKCGMPAKRDPDTLDTFVCSSWYFLRYPDNKNSEKAFDTEWINKMLPVDKYVGGAEHAAMHLLYARFVTKALRDMGYLDFDEPFLSLVHQGTILGPDGNRMSKSKGNTISPDDYIQEYGSDVFRMYLGFGFAYTEGGPWSDDGIKAISRFVGRLERLIESASALDRTIGGEYGSEEKELDFVRNTAIKGVTEDAERFQFNTSIARIMELVNALYKYESTGRKNNRLYVDTVTDLLKLLAPFAPHLAEELWEKMGGPYSIFSQEWPKWDEKALVRDETEIVIQLNGKIKEKVMVPSGLDKTQTEEAVMKNGKVAALLEGKTVVKVIAVPGRLVNIVVK
ncbi:MAG TPA: leucine--tRNA ligase [Clostridiales bacterium]|nr:leucine--tRNA ligase [Clostridiales bacterium]HPP34754.1 leucine--tRNA ligase [Clostridiales bacterium]